MAENFPTLMKDITPQFQQAQQNPGRIKLDLTISFLVIHQCKIKPPWDTYFLIGLLKDLKVI